jgi:hypothetical protein
MSGKQLQAIGVHGQDEFLESRKAKPFRTPRHRYCKKHRTYFCPDVYEGSKYGTRTIEEWDKAEKEYQEKKLARRQERALEPS